MIIYCLTNNVNGKAYVGQTVQRLSARTYDHGREKTAIGAALRKYGSENFTAEVLQSCRTQAALNRAEKKWIRDLDTMAPNGYNLHEGGKGGRLTPAHRRKIGDSLRGRKRSPEFKKKVSEGLKGRDITWAKKISDGSRKRWEANRDERCLEGLRKGRAQPQSAERRVRASQKNPTRRLSDDDIRAIRRNADRETQTALAERYGVTQCHVSRIQRRVAFGWLED